jgi:hypothetical protein
MLLQQAYACQKTYADKAEMMEYRDGMFQEILKDYALFEIKKAFIEHIRRSPDLPTPSDIEKLITEDRKYRNITHPDIEKLKSYREKGIPLTIAQKQQLDEHEATA